MTGKVVVILSGGLDSSTLLHHVKKNAWGTDCGVEAYALTYFYGQKHSKEIEMAEYQAKVVGVKEHKLIDISFLKDLTKGASALTDDAIQVPHIKDVLGDPQPLSYVPNRNMILLSISVSYAESVGSLDVFYGAQKHDTYSGYWDASPEFLDLMNKVLLLNRRNKVQIRAPFMNLKKKELIEIGMKLGVDYSKTWSCYNGREKACGVCGTCSDRIKAFKDMKMKDLLEYEIDINW